VRQGLVLLAHGARDPHWRKPFEGLASRLRSMRPGLDVRLAFLEIMKPDIHGAGRELVAAGCDALVVVPVFLGEGGHVRRDVPILVDALRKDHPGVTVTQSHTAGEDSRVLDALAAFCLDAVAKAPA
jgi:sirohydrochlorin cobaltochelatase